MLTPQERAELDSLLLSGRIDCSKLTFIDTEDGPVPFHEGQMALWLCQCRFIAAMAGWQSGKTECAIKWLMREVQDCGPGDYAVIGPDLPLLRKKVIPEFTRQLERKFRLGEYKDSKKVFEFSQEGMDRIFGRRDDGKPHEPTTIWFCHGDEPDSLESATYKAAVFDEAGASKIPVESFEALRARLNHYKGRILFTSRPYLFNWFYTDVHQKAGYKWSWQVKEKGKEPVIATFGEGNERIGVVNFSSLMNPGFDAEEYWNEKSEMPDYRHSLKYDAIFTRPAGAIYDCFTREQNTYDHPIPEAWPRYVGMDFGEVNTAAVFLAEDPDTLDLYVYGSYHTGSSTVEEHVKRIYQKALPGREEPEFELGVGGSWSEKDWRRDYLDAGLPLEKPPVKEVEVGIARVYRQVKTGRLKVHKSLEELITEFEGYSREVDDRGEPLDKIADKEKYHRLDALRYIVGTIRASAEPEITSYSRIGSQEKPREPQEADREQYELNRRIVEEEQKEAPKAGWESVEIA